MAMGSVAGVEIAAGVNGTSLGDPRFEPFRAAAEESDAVVFIYRTTRGCSAPAFAEHDLWNLVSNRMETTVAAAHLVLSGTTAQHARLHVLLVHGGGAIVALSGRLRHRQRWIATAGPVPASLQDALDAVVRQFLFDTVTHGRGAAAGGPTTAAADRDQGQRCGSGKADQRWAAKGGRAL